MLGSLDPAVDYEAFFLTLFDVHPAYMLHWSSMVSGVMPKYVEALPLLRLMSGSRERMDLQDGFMEAMLKNMAEDGLVYDRARPDRPWNTGVGYGVKDWDEDYANLAGNGRLLAGLTYWHQWTGEPRWKELAKKTAERMLELAVVRGDIAYYPNPGLGNDFSYPRKSGWTQHRSARAGQRGVRGGDAVLPLPAAPRLRPLLCADRRRAVPEALAEVREPRAPGEVLGRRSRHAPGAGRPARPLQGAFPRHPGGHAGPARLCPGRRRLRG